MTMTHSETTLSASDSRFASRTLRIDQVRREAEDVISIRLTARDGEALPEWTPGAHIDVVLPSGVMRQYSLCGDPADRSSYTFAVLKDSQGRGGSVELHQIALVGTTLEVRGPRNHFELAEASDYVFVAGGIGITPISTMVRKAHEAGASWKLFYGGRSRQHMAFVAEVSSLDESRVFVTPQDSDGLLDVERIVEQTSPEGLIYACGPTPMLSAFEEACASATPSRSLRIERFGAAPASDTDDGDSASAGDTEFEIELRQTGTVVIVPADRSALDVVREFVPDAPSSCEEGFCGACECRVLEGEPDHRDDVLSPEEKDENESMMLCVSRAKSRRLVIDL